MGDACDEDDDNDLLPDDIDDDRLAITVLPVAMSGEDAGTISHSMTDARAKQRRYRITITNPVQDAYKIGFMETGSAPNNTADNITTLTATTAGGVDHASRLRRGGISPVANPIAPSSGNTGAVYTFLPGDDGSAAPNGIRPSTVSAMLWNAYPPELLSSITYTMEVSVMGGVTYDIRVEKAIELPRLPAGIRTRARRGNCESTRPVGATNPVDGRCDEGGPSATGQGIYLVYLPVAGKIVVSQDIVVRNMVDDRIYETTPDARSDTDGDGLIGTTSVSFISHSDCMNSDGTSVGFLASDSPGRMPTINLGSTEQVYCVNISGAIITSNLASDNLQFTLNP